MYNTQKGCVCTVRSEHVCMMHEATIIILLSNVILISYSVLQLIILF